MDSDPNNYCGGVKDGRTIVDSGQCGQQPNTPVCRRTLLLLLNVLLLKVTQYYYWPDHCVKGLIVDNYDVLLFIDYDDPII